MGRRVAVPQIESRVRARRMAAGLSQAALAEQAGLTRQAVSAIEAGQYVPNTVVALRLARALDCAVEDLFAVPAEPRRVEAELLGADAVAAPGRVQLAQVGERLLARPLSGASAPTSPADGLLAPTPGTPSRRVAVDLLIDRATLDRTVVVAGCDPALALIGVHLARRFPAFRLQWVPLGSLSALRALARGEVHAAGSHLRDAATGEENVPFVRRELAGQRVLVVTLSRWQQGLIVAAGNPKGIVEVADLLRPDVAIVNREAGSGGRGLLDARLDTLSADFRPRGYGRERSSHLAVAEAIAGGAADSGPGILAAARAFGLDFIPLQDERYDLVIPVEHLEMAPVQALLEVVTGADCRREVEALGGYDSSPAGTVVAELPA